MKELEKLLKQIEHNSFEATESCSQKLDHELIGKIYANINDQAKQCLKLLKEAS